MDGLFSRMTAALSERSPIECTYVRPVTSSTLLWIVPGCDYAPAAFGPYFAVFRGTTPLVLTLLTLLSCPPTGPTSLQVSWVASESLPYVLIHAGLALSNKTLTPSFRSFAASPTQQQLCE
jgi:hypothetical protein